MNEMAPLEKLRIADPETHVRVTGRLALLADRPDDEWLARVVDDMIWALTQEAGLGRSVSDGLMRLVERGDPSKTTVYMDRVREATRTGPALGRILADHLAAVLLADPPLLEPFTHALAIMRTKGTYTLKEPLAVLTELLQAGEGASARAYLELLSTLFEQQISYNLSVRLVYVVPRAVRSFVPRRRAAQIEAFVRVVAIDLQLVDAFLEGMQNGLGLLAPRDLNDYLDQALARYRQSANAGLAFIGLSSKAGQAAYARLLVVVPLAQVKGPLDRYLNARIGRPVPVKALSGPTRTDIQWIASDGRTIYLADEIDRFERRDDNLQLAKILVRLEAGYFENGTFAFDLEKAVDLYPEVAEHSTRREQAADATANDVLRFINGFDHPGLAEDLFELFAQTRNTGYLAGHYPGLMKQALPLLRAEALLLKRSSSRSSVLVGLYDHLVLDMPIGPAGTYRHPAPLFHKRAATWRGHLNANAPIECCARLVCLAYDDFIAELRASHRRYDRLTTPFGRRLHWDLVARASAEQQMQAARVKIRLAEQGLSVYLSDVQDKLSDGQGRLSAEDVRSLVLSRARIRGRQAALSLDLNEADLNLLLEKAGVQSAGVSGDDTTGFRYPEWNDQLQDYLHDHVRVQESVVPAGGNGDFYRRTLDHYRGLVAHIRRAFEYLKPEGLTILRQWPDGDAFDHRALIDFAVDLRSGRTPSDRLFIKRLKHERDVAVLLLVDLSRSTANPVVGGRGTVLEVAKEALVLFCEALQVVGDTFAIAGFSGTGRHSVDYFRIKGFDDPFAGKVQARLSALTPQRSTRMGAAIRHATACLAPVPSRVRLIIIVSDGFPNDLGYKADYAIADTRRAVQEARAKSIHVKAITVNIGSDPRLDDLYGRLHHHVIGDVRELPDKLVRLYGTLTKRL
ncbi:nitric oxide reductase activation protein NorD [Desulfatitalea tepidiphila]|uniref:nitric oxide reductase activation protein NorD n=1 Tax=Desulfatitalea tepidiphila TaxID=1185843 RepID=UPI0006B51029|nr:VWA domain-containing protein [Desulfatitalea tepidiphila]